MDYEKWNDSTVWQIVNSTGIAVLFSLLSAVLFSLLLGFAPLSDRVILPVCIALRTVAIFLGSLFGIRGEKGWMKGLVAGILTAMATRTLFSALSGDWSGGLGVLIDLFFGAAIGTICGVLALNIKER